MNPHLLFAALLTALPAMATTYYVSPQGSDGAPGLGPEAGRALRTVQAGVDKLQPGEALLLVNDHDPKPLFYQFQAEASGEFTWDYLENGPEVWQVRIGKPEEHAQPIVAKACAH